MTVTIQQSNNKPGKKLHFCGKMSPKSTKLFFFTQHCIEQWEAGAMETWSSVWVAQWATGRDRDVPELFSSWFKQLAFFSLSPYNQKLWDKTEETVGLIYFPNLKPFQNKLSFHGVRVVDWLMFTTLYVAFWQHTSQISSLLDMFLEQTASEACCSAGKASNQWQLNVEWL